MAKFHAPDPFTFDRPTAWPEWKKRFERYRIASELTAKDEHVQVSTLIYAMGPDAEHIFESFTFASDDDDKNFDVVLNKFDEHFVPKKNIIFERAKFHKRKQEDGESVEAFIRALYDLSVNCDFKALRDDFIRDKLVIGLKNKELSEELQMKSELTLSMAIDQSRHHELIKTQNMIDKPVVSEARRDSQRGRHRRGASRHGSHPPSRRPDQPTSDVKICRACGFDEKRSHKHGRCPAKYEQCRFCKLTGHFERACLKKKKKLHQVESYEAPREDEERYFLGAVRSTIVDTLIDEEPPWFVKVKINNTDTIMKIDSGADVNIITNSEYQRLMPKPTLLRNNAVLSSVSGEIACLGQFDAIKDHKGKRFLAKVHVVNHKTHNLLSRQTASAMGLVKRIEEVRDVFGDMGLMKCKPVKIKLKHSAQPYSIPVPRRIPIPLMKQVEEELERMVTEEVIAKVTEPTDWCSPMVVVLKPSGKVRICVDLKKLNSAVKRERYVIPTIDDIFYKLRGSTLFTSLDASSGYWQMPLDEDSSALTTFITPFGRFRFRRLPYGISSASEIYQREMSRILEGLDGVEVYQDDVIVHGNGQEHDARLEAVMKRIASSGLKLNKKKCHIRQKSINFLGHKISADGIAANAEKVKAIQQMKEPTNVTELRSFQGMVNFMARFLPGLSDIMEPLNKLLCKDNEWVWDDQQRSAFIKVKEAISSHVMLAFYDPKLPTKVFSDASSYGIGAAIMQEDKEKGYRPIAFVSRTLTSAERNYAQIEKELLGVVWACEKFARYLVGLESFVAVTDHKPLIPIINTKDLDVTPLRCQKLLLRLMRFSVQAEYAPGKTLVTADLLSRKPLDDLGEDKEEEMIAHVQAAVALVPMTRSRLDIVREATREDDLMNAIMDFVRNGWPPRIRDVEDDFKMYYYARGSLSITDGMLMHDNRIVVPSCLREDTLAKIHQGHLGINKCRERAHNAVWWPGILLCCGCII